jgi:hypothetical protein
MSRGPVGWSPALGGLGTIGRSFNAGSIGDRVVEDESGPDDQRDAQQKLEVRLATTMLAAVSWNTGMPDTINTRRWRSFRQAGRGRSSPKARRDRSSSRLPLTTVA